MVWVFFNSFVESTAQKLLACLCSNDMTPKEHLESQQALFKQFAEILDFTLKFDDLKVSGSKEYYCKPEVFLYHMVFNLQLW